ncbi:MAG: hypothetical protein H7Z42_20775 [Roseiflexaceae bacterium]|nr:hypothetical protein [Roseiflexaceae bacterium]
MKQSAASSMGSHAAGFTPRAPTQRGKRGDGSSYQLNDGTWRVAVPFGKGRMRTARAHAAAEAEEHRRALIRQREAGIVAKLPATVLAEAASVLALHSLLTEPNLRRKHEHLCST